MSTTNAANKEWAVYTRLDRSSIYTDYRIVEERCYETREEAEDFLQSPAFDKEFRPTMSERGWAGPIPIVGVLIKQHGVAFDGPRLRERLAFANVEPEEPSFDEAFEEIWRDEAVDDAADIISELVAEGLIPENRSPEGLRTLNDEQSKLVQERLEARSLRPTTCYLAEEWDFRYIASQARLRYANIIPDPSKTHLNRLLDSAVDLESVLRARHDRLSAADIANFWTSLQVQRYLAEFSRDLLWKRELFNDSDVELARHHFARALASYSIEVTRTLTYKKAEATASEAASVASQAAANSASHNRFVRHGKSWKLRFNGRETKVEHTVGMDYIQFLLKSPERDIPAEILLASEFRKSPDELDHSTLEHMSTSDSPQPLMDHKYRTDIKARLNRLSRERKEAEERNDVARIERLDRECADVASFSNRAKGRAGSIRDFATGASKGANTVSKAIKRSIDKITEHDASLGGHLQKGINRGGKCTYKPETPTAWIFETDE